MARIRLINPEAPKDEAVAGLSMPARLAWAYLPCHADREGRLPDKPFTLRLEIFPTDEVDMEALLVELAAAGLILRYQAEGRRCIQVRSFGKHQKPHRNERGSVLPPPSSGDVASTPDKPRGFMERSGHYASALPDPDPVLDPVADPDPDPGRDPVDPDQSPPTVRTGPEGLSAPEPRPAVPISTTLRQLPGAPRVTSQQLMDLFGRVRSEVVGGLPWQMGGAGAYAKAAGLAGTFDEYPDAVPDIEPTMRLLLGRAKDSQDPRDGNPSFAFGSWVAQFTALREELHGMRRRPAAGGEDPCSFHRYGKNQGKPAAKYDFRPSCPECKHLQILARPRPASGPQGVGDLMNGGR